MMIQTLNPATEQTIASYATLSAEAVQTVIDAAHHSFLNWRKTDFTQRQSLLLNLKNLLAERKEIFARMITTEMGKPITQAYAEVDKCAFLCDYYAARAATFLAPRLISTEFQKSYVCYQPLGIIFAIMPWNFPLWQVLRCLIPAILAGNAGLLKHAPNVTGCALLIEQLFKDAGFPENLCRILIIEENSAAQIIADPRIAAVSLTGSQRAGAAVAAQAGKALKKVILELGGSDPYLILADADLELAAETCIKSRLNNMGQVCIAAKRLIIEQAVYDDFKNRLLNKLTAYQFGDPQQPDCLLGPLARADLRTTLHQQVTASVQQGAHLLLGGTMPETTGFYYPVTVLENVQPGMPAYEEELFGPVITLMPARDCEQAVAIANALNFGLGAAVFTQDLAKGEAIAEKELAAGACFVNAMVASDPRLPFGGIKASGFGRELSEEGIREFTNVKTVVISRKTNKLSQ